MAFISSSFLIRLARTSRAMSNRSGKNGHPCLFPSFRGKGKNGLLPLSMMLAAGFFVDNSL